MKKGIAIILSSVFALSTVALAGCRRDEGEEIDTTKTQLYISNYDAGIGQTWLNAVVDEFEEDFAEYSFEEGKKGVQVFIDNNRNDTGTTFLETIGNSSNYVFFSENIDYLSLSSKLEDVTGIMNEGAITGVDSDGNFIRESGKIIDKLDPTLKDALNMGTDQQAKYTVFPFYTLTKTPVYDVDLWDSAGFYFSEGGCPSEVVAAVLNKEDHTQAELEAAIAEYESMDKTDKANYFFVDEDGHNANDASDTRDFGLSAGPDGYYGTEDDGMPATYDEFYYLCNYMVSKSVTPFIWTGKVPDYAEMLTTTLWHNYAGAEQIEVYYSLQGTAKDLIKLDDNGEIVYDANGDPVIDDPVELLENGKTNGFELQRAAGKFYALQFAEKIAHNTNWTHNATCYAGVSHIAAQATYITSITNAPRIAMIMEGGWWQQESQNTFDIMEKEDEKYSIQNRRFGVMYMPNANIEKYVSKQVNNEKNVLVVPNDSFCFIKGGLTGAALNVSKAFMSYVHSDEMLNKFTEYTYIKRSMNYEFSETTLDSMTYYGQSALDYIENCDVVYPYTRNTFVRNNISKFKNAADSWNWRSYSASFGDCLYPITSLHDSTLRKKGISAETYFEGLYRYYKDTSWSSLV